MTAKTNCGSARRERGRSRGASSAGARLPISEGLLRTGAGDVCVKLRAPLRLTDNKLHTLQNLGKSNTVPKTTSSEGHADRLQKRTSYGRKHCPDPCLLGNSPTEFSGRESLNRDTRLSLYTLTAQMTTRQHNGPACDQKV